ncbi:MAG: tRNA dimethylallyltransferase [Vicingaceae bacterium]
MKKKILISIVGPTAVGKTATAIELAKQFEAEIISSDSRQFYKEISIGTAKPTADELAKIPHHFINNLSISESYNASFFEDQVIEFLNSYFKTNDVAIMCGGSGMYVNAVLKGFDSEIPTANEKLRTELNSKYQEFGLTYLQNILEKIDPIHFGSIDIHNSKRLIRAIEICKITGKSNAEIKKGEAKQRPFNTIEIGLELPRPCLYEQINQRVDLMLGQGLVEEVKSLQEHKNNNALKTVGYKETFDYLDGIYTLEECTEKIKTNSRRYAKRQLTWFKRNQELVWFSPKEINKISKYIRTKIEQQ